MTRLMLVLIGLTTVVLVVAALTHERQALRAPGW